MNDAPTAGSGRPAPDFTLPASGGRRVALADFRDRKVVLYFYPKDDTSGCTREALDFTALAGAFETAGTVVLGVSREPVARHERFIAKHGLGITLLADEEGEVCRRYGTWVEKSMYGRRYMGIERTTFLIDADGVIRRAWRKVKVPGHAEAVLEAARAL